MTYGELKRELKKSGCYFLYCGSRHEMWENPKTGKLFPVGRHDTKEIPSGTLGSIELAAGLI